VGRGTWLEVQVTFGEQCAGELAISVVVHDIRGLASVPPRYGFVLFVNANELACVTLPIVGREGWAGTPQETGEEFKSPRTMPLTSLDIFSRLVDCSVGCRVTHVKLTRGTDFRFIFRSVIITVAKLLRCNRSLAR